MNVGERMKTKRKPRVFVVILVDDEKIRIEIEIGV